MAENKAEKYSSGEALVGLSGVVLTKDEEQRFSEMDRSLMLVHFKSMNDRLLTLEMEREESAKANAELDHMVSLSEGYKSMWRSSRERSVAARTRLLSLSPSPARR